MGDEVQVEGTKPGNDTAGVVASASSADVSAKAGSISSGTVVVRGVTLGADRDTTPAPP